VRDFPLVQVLQHQHDTLGIKSRVSAVQCAADPLAGHVQVIAWDVLHQKIKSLLVLEGFDEFYDEIVVELDEDVLFPD
jgi:hypothetical protein